MKRYFLGSFVGLVVILGLLYSQGPAEVMVCRPYVVGTGKNVAGCDMERSSAWERIRIAVVGTDSKKRDDGF